MPPLLIGTNRQSRPAPRMCIDLRLFSEYGPPPLILSKSPLVAVASCANKVRESTDGPVRHSRKG